MRTAKALLPIVAFILLGARGCPPPPGRPTAPPPQASKPTPVKQYAAAEGATLGAGADSVMEINPGRKAKDILPGAYGWGNQWVSRDLWPKPPANLNDASHRAYIAQVAKANAPLVKQADVRNMSWPWGVTFGSWGVNWENTIGPYSKRTQDCARRGGRGSGWCETAIVGLDDFLTLAQGWGLEAITIGASVAVYDGGENMRWGPNLLTNAFDGGAIENLSNHAVKMVEHMKRHPGWNGFQRVYLAMGCEWRHYSLFPPSQDVLTYVQLVKTVRKKINDPKIVIVAVASDSADYEPQKANSWNKPLYDGLVGTPGVVVDLHRYRGQNGLEGGFGGVQMTPHNIDALMQTGVSQREYFDVRPSHWGGRGEPMPSVLLENAILGKDTDHNKKGRGDRPWPVSMAFADLLREAFASDAQTFLGWLWAPMDVPPEWPFGAHDGRALRDHAVAGAFLAQYHRGSLWESAVTGSPNIRGNATDGGGRGLFAYGGNFSRTPTSVGFFVRGGRVSGGSVEILGEKGSRTVPWNGQTPIPVGPLELWRVAFR